MNKTYKTLTFASALALALSAEAVGWRNVTESNYLGGRKASEGYLQGKVVMVDRWGLRCPPCRALLPRLQQIWESFKTKPFVLLGGHCKGWGNPAGVQSLIKQNTLTYPIYEDAGLEKGEPEFNAIPFLYVVDETGRVLYKGHDERIATETVVIALTDMESPKSVQQWKYFLNYELDNLPGRGYLRLKAFRDAYPDEAREYGAKAKELIKIPGLKELASLVEFARKAKDTKPFDAKQQMAKQKFVASVKAALAKYAPLKESTDPRVAQEAKNSIADLQWMLKTL